LALERIDTNNNQRLLNNIMGCDSSKMTGAMGGGAGGGNGGGNGGGEHRGGNDSGRGDGGGGGGRGGNQGYSQEEEDPIRIRKEPPMQLGHASSEGLRDGKGFSSAQFESTSEYDYLFKILLLGTPTRTSPSSSPPSNPFIFVGE
jgi:hypothetical protein